MIEKNILYIYIKLVEEDTRLDSFERYANPHRCPSKARKGINSPINPTIMSINLRLWFPSPPLLSLSRLRRQSVDRAWLNLTTMHFVRADNKEDQRGFTHKDLRRAKERRGKRGTRGGEKDKERRRERARARRERSGFPRDGEKGRRRAGEEGVARCRALDMLSLTQHSYPGPKYDVILHNSPNCIVAAAALHLPYFVPTFPFPPSQIPLVLPSRVTPTRSSW